MKLISDIKISNMEFNKWYIGHYSDYNICFIRSLGHKKTCINYRANTAGTSFFVMWSAPAFYDMDYLFNQKFFTL